MWSAHDMMVSERSADEGWQITGYCPFLLGLNGK